MRPLVGITLCLDAGGRWRAGREYLYGDRAYTQAVEDAGGVPLLLPVQHDAAPLLDRIDALLLPGGDDLLPDADASYPPDVRFEPAPPPQLAFDRALLAGALERGLPVLGICYGMQLLALHLGGALHYHLPLDLPEASRHQLDEARGRHPLEVVPGTRLAAALGADAGPVNSLHHQAVAAPGAGLRVSARAPDGVVEAVEVDGERFCVGVQWHPEKLDGPSRTALFAALIEACG